MFVFIYILNVILGGFFMLKKLIIMVASLCSVCSGSNSFAMELKGNQKELMVEYIPGKYPDSINVAAKIFDDFGKENTIILASKYKNSSKISYSMYVRDCAGIFNKSKEVGYPEIVKILKEKIAELEK
jgi:hypothetical protein